MPIFRLGCEVTVSAYTDVEADSLEAAILISEQREIELSFVGSGNSSRDVWLVEDPDGIPSNIHRG
jgi:hypothetical protein